MQECALAQNIVFLCGPHEIAFDLLRDAVQASLFRIFLRDASGAKVELQDMYARETMHIRALVQYSIGPRELSEIATSMALYTECFHARDRVFGTLGLLHDPEEPDFVSEFQAAQFTLTIPGMYLNFTTTLLVSIDGLEWWKWLSLAFSYGRIEGLASWVPDLHHLGEKYSCWPWFSIMHTHSRDKCVFKASSRTEKVKVVPGMPELTIEGHICDRISVVHPAIRHAVAGDELEDIIQHVLAMVKWEQSLAAMCLDDQSADDGRSLDGLDDQITHPRVPLEVYFETLLAGIHIHDGETYTLDHYFEYRSVMYRLVELLDKYEYMEWYVTLRSATLFQILS
jgi:hypothetical protein